MEISVFGDEIAVDFETQLRSLEKLAIGYIDVRRAWSVRCNQFTTAHVARIKTLCKDYNIRVACMGSPIGKSPIDDPIENELAALRRMAEIAHQLGTSMIRIFSFYPESDGTNAVEKAIERLERLSKLANELDVYLLLENEKRLVGDTPVPCHKILQAIDSPRLRFIWDPANFVQCGVANQVEKWWELLSPYLAYIHIKDARLSDGVVVPAGEGDGQLEHLLASLAEDNYNGILSLEPHLSAAGEYDGFSGEEKTKIAVTALRKLMINQGIQEGNDP